MYSMILTIDIFIIALNLQIDSISLVLARILGESIGRILKANSGWSSTQARFCQFTASLLLFYPNLI